MTDMEQMQSQKDLSQDKDYLAKAGESSAASIPEHPALAGKYEIIQQLGHGAQGTVFKAKNTDGELVAIKVFDFRLAPDWKAVDLLKREV
ncbi:MAG: hypothetical protein J6A01_01625, partial [Proteobacteria bacterium]|nr:hypothetical protein [Pseudomonadota bacterium]